MLLLRRFLLSLTLALLLIAGCSGKRSQNTANLSGKLSYKDQPIKAGVMQIYTEQGLYSATINPDGTYTATQLPPGKATVTIETESINPNKPVYGGGKYEVKKSKAEKEPEALEYVKIPLKYRQENTSDLKIELKPGKNTHDFNLTD
jgi:hypothetical protein